MSDKQTRLDNYDDNRGGKIMGKDMEFEKLRIKEILSDVSGGNAFKSGDYVDDKDGIPLIRSMNFTDVETPHPVGDFKALPKEFEQEYDTYLLHGGEVLLSMVGQNGQVCLIPENSNFLLNQNIWNLEPDDNLINWYLYYLLDGNRGEVLRSERGTTRKFLGRTEFENIKFPIPPLSEQEKIATVLYTVDRAIKKTERIVEQMDIVQQSLLRSLFGKEKQKRDPDIETKTERLGPKQFNVPVTWNVTDISSIGKVVTGDTPSTDNETNFGGDLPFVTPETLSQGKYVTRSERTLSEAGRREAKPIPEGSVMMDCIGSDMGKVAVADREVATNQQINSVVIEDSEYVPEFLYYHLRVLSDFIKSQAGQTATPIVNKSSFESFAIFKPPIEEQREIVDNLSVYDEGRQINEEYLAKLTRLKQGLMQDLLSGKVRTTDTNIQVPDEVAQYG